MRTDRGDIDRIAELEPVINDELNEIGGGLTATDKLFQARPKTFARHREGEFKDQKKKFGVHHGESHRLKSLFLNGFSVMTPKYQETRKVMNPIWMELAKCSQPIKGADEMKKMVEHYAHTDRAMVVRYYQDNCTACNAVEKSYEFICHESKKNFPELDFYEVHKESNPDLVKGMVRFPQVKAYSGGQWTDMDFKPHQEFRDSLYNKIGKEIDALRDDGEPVTALQAEEMYFSAAGPAMYTVMNDSIGQWYIKSRVRMHNYWKQVSVRRSWFYKKYIEPRVDPEVTDAFRAASVMGERVELTAMNNPALNEEFTGGHK